MDREIRQLEKALAQDPDNEYLHDKLIRAWERLLPDPMAAENLRRVRLTVGLPQWWDHVCLQPAPVREPMPRGMFRRWLWRRRQNQQLREDPSKFWRPNECYYLGSQDNYDYYLHEESRYLEGYVQEIIAQFGNGRCDYHLCYLGEMPEMDFNPEQCDMKIFQPALDLAFERDLVQPFDY